MKNLYKTISWLIVSGVLIAACNWYEIGDLKTACLGAFWSCVFKTPVYWIHELIWNKKVKKHDPIDPQIVCVACEQALQAQ